MRSTQDAWDQLCGYIASLRSAGYFSRGQLEQIAQEAERLHSAGVLSDDRLLRLSRALLSPEDFMAIDALAYGIAQLLNTPIAQLAAEAQAHRAARETPSVSRVSNQLLDLPGHAGSGIVLQNPHDPPPAWYGAYEVRWLRGYPIPALPASVDGYPVKIVVVDALPAPYG